MEEYYSKTYTQIPITLCYVEYMALYLIPATEPLEVYFINDTPQLSGGSVFAEFETNRPGVEMRCHLTHLDSALQDCKLLNFL